MKRKKKYRDFTTFKIILYTICAILGLAFDIFIIWLVIEMAKAILGW